MRTRLHLQVEVVDNDTTLSREEAARLPLEPIEGHVEGTTGHVNILNVGYTLKG